MLCCYLLGLYGDRKYRNNKRLKFNKKTALVAKIGTIFILSP